MIAVFCYTTHKMNSGYPKLYQEDPGHQILSGHMSDDAYKEALDSMVVVCVDAVLIDEEKQIFYLPRRKQKPMDSWWVIGGRLPAGVFPEVGMQKKFKAETGLQIEKDRFNFVCMNRYLFKDRQQEPQNHGADSLSYTYYLVPTQQELEAISSSLEENEYDTEQKLKSFSRQELVEEKVHPMLIDLWDKIFSK